jgi:hypothetical protein
MFTPPFLRSVSVPHIVIIISLSSLLAACVFGVFSYIIHTHTHTQREREYTYHRVLYTYINICTYINSRWNLLHLLCSRSNYWHAISYFMYHQIFNIQKFYIVLALCLCTDSRTRATCALYSINRLVSIPQ